MTGLRTSLASIATGGPNRAAEALAHAPLLVMSQHTPCGNKGADEGLRPFEPQQAPKPPNSSATRSTRCIPPIRFATPRQRARRRW